MAKIINISEKLSLEKPCIKVGDKEYAVDDSLQTVLKFEEMYDDSRNGTQDMLECMKLSIGEEAYNELEFEKMSFKNIQVWFIAIMAAMQDSTYEEVEERFHQLDKVTP